MTLFSENELRDLGESAVCFLCFSSFDGQFPRPQPNDVIRFHLPVNFHAVCRDISESQKKTVFLDCGGNEPRSSKLLSMHFQRNCYPELRHGLSPFSEENGDFRICWSCGMQSSPLFFNGNPTQYIFSSLLSQSRPARSQRTGKVERPTFL